MIPVGIPRPSSEMDTDPSTWIATLIRSQNPARCSSMELSSTSKTRWCKPRSSGSPMNIPGRFRTASSPSSLSILEASYTSSLETVIPGSSASDSAFGIGAPKMVQNRGWNKILSPWNGPLEQFFLTRSGRQNGGRKRAQRDRFSITSSSPPGEGPATPFWVILMIEMTAARVSKNASTSLIMAMELLFSR